MDTFFIVIAVDRTVRPVKKAFSDLICCQSAESMSELVYFHLMIIMFNINFDVTVCACICNQTSQKKLILIIISNVLSQAFLNGNFQHPNNVIWY